MPFSTNRPFTFDRVVRLALSVLFIVCGIFLLRYLSDVLIPFAVAMVLAYIINPLVLFFEYRMRIRNRTIAVGLSLFLVFLGVVLSFLLFVPTIIEQIVHTGELISNYINSSQLRDRVLVYLPDNFNVFINEFLKRPDVQTFLSGNISTILSMLQAHILPGVWRVFSGSWSVVMSVVGLVVIVLYLIFILLDYERVAEGWEKLIPANYRTPVLQVVDDLSNSMNSYFRAQLLVATITGVLHAIGFTIIGLPMGIVLGLFVGLLNMVPYLQIVGFIPALFLAIIHAIDSGTSIGLMIGLVLFIFALLQLLQDALLTPRIMGSATGLNPAIIMLSLSIWGKLLGFLGLIIAIPLTTVLINYYKRFITKSEEEHLPQTQIGSDGQEV
jgi:predicted PurR-regulated permease PerM